MGLSVFTLARRGGFLLLTSAFSLFTSLSAQVVIRDSIKIIPKQNITFPNGDNSMNSVHTLSAEIEWDQSYQDVFPDHYRARLVIEDRCGGLIETDWVYDGYATLSTTTTTASIFDVYPVTEIQTSTPGVYYPFAWRPNLKIFADGAVIYDTNSIGGTTIKPWRSDLNLDIGSYFTNIYDYAICPGEGVFFNLKDIDCNPALWSAVENNINISIIEGGEFTSFYDYYTNEFLGDNIGISADIHGNYSTNFQTVRLVYDEEYNDSTEPKEIILEARVNDITARDTTIIFPTSNSYVVNGEIEDYVQSIIRWERLNINAWIETIGYCGGTTEPPENTTFNAEIIQGIQYGGLVNPSSGKTTSQLSGLLAVNGQINLEYFADGELTEDEEEVIVRISCSVPNSTPLVISFNVRPAELLVLLDPENISLGDTSGISVFWYNEMGSLELVPDDIQFQVEIIDGEDYGNLYDPINDQFSDTFDELYQGFKFKAEEDIDTNSASVLIRVSTFYFGGGISSAVKNDEKVEAVVEIDNKKKIVSKKSDSKLKKNEKTLINKDNNNTTNLFFGYEIYGIGKVQIGSVSLDHFAITILPDTISTQDTLSFTETARIFVQAKDADSNDVELGENTLLDFAVTTNTAYGTFIDVNGDTLLSTPVVLNNVNYGDANTGVIRFAAVKQNPDSVINCNVRVDLSDDNTKYGEREAIVLEQTLKIVMEEPYDVIPIVDPGIVNLGNTTLQNLENYRKTFLVSMTRGGVLVNGHRFRIFTEYVRFSGGHNHSTTTNILRPTDTDNIKFWHYGHFRKTNDSNNLFNPIYDTTMVDYSSNEFNYISSKWGNTIKVYLFSEENDLFKDSISINELVPNLVLLPDNDNYVKVGGRCEHHGPSDRERNCDDYLTPDNNHYGQQSTNDALNAIAQQYHMQYPDDNIIFINDMSLPGGGRFDIFGRWVGSHIYHRFGLDVDIRSTTIPIGDSYLDQNRNGRYDQGEQITIDHNNNGVYERNRQGFEDICRANGVVDPDLEYAGGNNEHYHLYFWNYGAGFNINLIGE